VTRKLLRSVFACLMLFASAVLAVGQTDAGDRAGSGTTAQNTPSDITAQRTSADETFELNITERRITRRDYENSTSVEVFGEGTRGVNLRVGVAVGATSIDVLLRNVRGRVRFRGSLEQLLQRINARRPPPLRAAP
jgi:hypothetical protein